MSQQPGGDGTMQFFHAQCPDCKVETEIRIPPAGLIQYHQAHGTMVGQRIPDLAAFGKANMRLTETIKRQHLVKYECGPRRKECWFAWQMVN